MKKEIYLKVVDHAVTKEPFELLYDPELEMLCTIPQPDDKDLVKYYESEDYISHTDTKASAIDRVYQWVRSYTLKRKLKLINSFQSKKKSILDVGAGTGDFLTVCYADGWNVSGVEPNKGARIISEKKLGFSIFSELTDVDKEQFDVITMWHVLEHVPDLNHTISELKKCLKANGRLVIAVPNHKSYDAEYYGSYWAAYDVPRHFWHFSQQAIHSLCKNHGLEVETILPMKFDAYYVSLLSEKYKTGSMNPIRAFWRGFVSNQKAKRSSEYSSLIYIVKKSK